MHIMNTALYKQQKQAYAKCIENTVLSVWITAAIYNHGQAVNPYIFQLDYQKAMKRSPFGMGAAVPAACC